MEVNPGPTKKLTLKVLSDEQRGIKAQLDVIETNQKTQAQSLENLTKRISDLEEKFPELANLGPMVTECRKSFEENPRVIQTLRAKVDDLENRGRRCNLLFFGIDDKDATETWAASEKLVQKLCTEKLQINPQTIARAHRIGKFNPERKRPLIVNFASFKEKEAILTSAKMLKNTGISLSEDFSEQVRRKRKLLWEFAKTNKQADTRVNLRLDVLYLDKVKYVVDEKTNQVVKPK